MTYGLILADPPWNYTNQATRASTENHYPTMKPAEIKALPITDICDTPSVLFMWVTWPNLPLGLEVIDAWGFEYKTLAWTWLKTTNDGKKLRFGIGNYTRSNSEPCLLAFKRPFSERLNRPLKHGERIPVADHSVPSWIMSPRRKHSQKPDQQYDYINRLYPDLPKVELFARQIWPGWDAWGLDLKDGVQLW